MFTQGMNSVYIVPDMNSSNSLNKVFSSLDDSREIVAHFTYTLIFAFYEYVNKFLSYRLNGDVSPSVNTLYY